MTQSVNDENGKEWLRLLTPPLISKSGRSTSISIAPRKPDLSDDKIKVSVERLESWVQQRTKMVTNSHTRLFKAGESALKKLAHEGEYAKLTKQEQDGTRAIIVADGTRPMIRVSDENTLIFDKEDSGYWSEHVNAFLPAIQAVLPSVGCVSIPAKNNVTVGTAFVIGGDTVLTNRHVAEVIAQENYTNSSSKWSVNSNAVVTFGRDTYKVIDVPHAGPEKIDGKLKLHNLDAAILRIARQDKDDWPNAVQYDHRNKLVSTGRRIYIIGFPSNDSLGGEIQDIDKLLKGQFGVKHLMPGYILTQPNELPDDVEAWVITHDASTLAGCSGSCVVEFEHPDASSFPWVPNIIGLHIGGNRGLRNFAHGGEKFWSAIQSYN